MVCHTRNKGGAWVRAGRRVVCEGDVDQWLQEAREHIESVHKRVRERYNTLNIIKDADIPDRAGRSPGHRKSRYRFLVGREHEWGVTTRG